MLLVGLFTISCEPEQQEITTSEKAFLDQMNAYYDEFYHLSLFVGADGTSGEQIKDAYYRSKTMVGEIRAMQPPD